MTECLFIDFGAIGMGKSGLKVLLSQFTPPKLVRCCNYYLFLCSCTLFILSKGSVTPLVQGCMLEAEDGMIRPQFLSDEEEQDGDILTPISLLYPMLSFFFALKPDKFKIWDFFFLLSVPTNFMVTLISIYEVTMLLPCLSPAHTAINWMPSGRGGFAMFAFIPWVFSALKAEALHVTEWMKQKFNFPALHPSFSTDKVYMLPSAPCFPQITAFLFSFLGRLMEHLWLRLVLCTVQVIWLGSWVLGQAVDFTHWLVSSSQWCLFCWKLQRHLGG